MASRFEKTGQGLNTKSPEKPLGGIGLGAFLAPFELSSPTFKFKRMVSGLFVWRLAPGPVGGWAIRWWNEAYTFTRFNIKHNISKIQKTEGNLHLQYSTLSKSMGRLIVCLVLLLELHVLCITSHNVLPLVKPSEYASMGKVSQYVGHINDLNGLKAALTACSYKNEIILISTTSTFVDAAAQTIDMLRCVCDCVV